jgi:peptidoglycan/xylan/chitin deacetylase (PgdA/CDA1 family)
LKNRPKPNRRSLRTAAWYAAAALSLGVCGARAQARETAAASDVAGFIGKISPNTFTAIQARETLLTERDSYWEAALHAAPTPTQRAGPTLSCSLFGHGARSRREIVLTFDDGPHPGYTPELLAVLERYHVPATFFVVGEMAERAPYLVRDEIADGDSVGNHTYHHVSLVKITPGEAADEIRACGLVLQSITGKPARLFRPPGGRYDAAVTDAATAQGYRTVLWTDDPGDYASPGVDTIVERTVRTAHNGGILLLHDGIQQTIDALPRIIGSLRASGFTFVTMDQMLIHAAPDDAVKIAARTGFHSRV